MVGFYSQIIRKPIKKKTPTSCLRLCSFMHACPAYFSQFDMAFASLEGVEIKPKRLQTCTSAVRMASKTSNLSIDMAKDVGNVNMRFICRVLCIVSLTLVPQGAPMHKKMTYKHAPRRKKVDPMTDLLLTDSKVIFGTPSLSKVCRSLGSFCSS